MSPGPAAWRSFAGAPAPGTRLCRADEIAEGGTRIFACGADEDRPDARFEMFVLRWQSRPLAYVNDCPHAHTPLDWPRGKLFDRDGRRLMCVTHNAFFRPEDGRCTAGPCEGRSLTPVPLELIDGQLAIGRE